MMRQDTKKTFKRIALALFFVCIITYAFWGSKDLIFGVKIRSVSLVDGAKVTENSLRVTGSAKNAVKLVLNGREISIDQEGNFEETILILPGYNVVKIEAEDKFGNTDEKNYKLTL